MTRRLPRFRSRRPVGSCQHRHLYPHLPLHPCSAPAEHLWITTQEIEILLCRPHWQRALQNHLHR